MSQHEEETSFIKTPQLLLTVVVLAFVVPIFGVLLLVKFVVEKPHADTGALTPEAVAARIQPVGRIDFGEAAWAPRIKTGTDAMVKSVLGGKGAMPPKGGNATLSEAEIRGVVEFMVSQSK